jgi:drug/metabolite transporter (DMT)-like permease
MDGAGGRAVSGQTGAPLWSSVTWLLVDMALVTTMQALVKAQGDTYPAVQLVFLRSLVGLVSVLPLVWKHRRAFAHLSHVRRQLVRVAFNSAALTLNFAAFATLPLALITAVGFTRPLVLLALASFMLGESVNRVRYLMAALGFCGVLVMVRPGAGTWNMGLAAAFAAVLLGSIAIVQTRRLARENTTVMMLFYTVGLSAFTAIPAAFVWVPVPLEAAPSIVLVGVLAQLGQYCWLQAYQKQEARLLAPIGYLSILFSTAAGWLWFGEKPTLSLALGAAVVVSTTVLASPAERLLQARRKDGSRG